MEKEGKQGEEITEYYGGFVRICMYSSLQKYLEQLSLDT